MKKIIIFSILFLVAIFGIWYNFNKDSKIVIQAQEKLVTHQRIFTPGEIVACVQEIPIGEAIEGAMDFAFRLSRALANIQWATNQYRQTVPEIADLASQCDSRFCQPSCELTPTPAAKIRVQNIFEGKVVASDTVNVNIIKPLAVNNSPGTSSQLSSPTSGEINACSAYSTSAVNSGVSQLALGSHILLAVPSFSCNSIDFSFTEGTSSDFLYIQKGEVPEAKAGGFVHKEWIFNDTSYTWPDAEENSLYKARVFSGVGAVHSNVVTIITPVCPPQTCQQAGGSCVARSVCVKEITGVTGCLGPVEICCETLGTPNITITNPLSGVNLRVGTLVTILWKSEFLPGGTIKILLQAEGAPDPSAWKVIADLPLTQTSFSWTVPDFADKCEILPCTGDPCWQRDEIENKYQQLASLSRTIIREKETIDILLNERRPEIRKKLDEARRLFEKNAPTVELYQLLRGSTPCEIAISNFWVELQDVQDKKVCKSLYNWLICR